MDKLDTDLIEQLWDERGAAAFKMTLKDVFLFGVGVGAGMATEETDIINYEMGLNHGC